MSDAEAAEHREMLPAPASREAGDRLRLEATWGKTQGAATTAQADQDRQFETLLRTAGEKSPMPFTEWAVGQTDGQLLTSTPEYLAMRLDEAYGGPTIVDRFFERGLRHIVDDDLGSTCRRVRQWLAVLDIVERRTEARARIEKAHIDLEKLEQQAKNTIRVDSRLTHVISVNRDALDRMQNEVLEPIRRQAKYAGELGLTRLERQYLDIISNYPWRY